MTEAFFSEVNRRYWDSIGPAVWKDCLVNLSEDQVKIESSREAKQLLKTKDEWEIK